MRIYFRKPQLLLLGVLIASALIFLFFSPTERPDIAHTPPEFSKVLLAGFEPFGGEQLNSSWEAINYWDNHVRADRFSNTTFRTIRLPVDYDKSVKTLTSILDEWSPDVILMFGMYWEDNGVRLEQFARSKSWLGGKKATRLPIAKLESVYRDAGIKTYVSNDAGSYVCNYLFVKFHLLINSSLGCLMNNLGSFINHSIVI